TRIRLLSEFSVALKLAWLMAIVLSVLCAGLTGRWLQVQAARQNVTALVAVIVGLVAVLAAFAAIRWWEHRHRMKLLGLMNRLSWNIENVGVTLVEEPPARADDAGGYVS
ncbi:MAG TPA: hypothetical protein VM328_10905, partial [Fimbriimonadaceae bacterium]|nr:hypothetical protein [Fimbriimonadaceae bacterium]